MPCSLANLDVFPPANPSDFDGRILLNLYRPISLLEMTPADFRAAYDFVCFVRSSFITNDNKTYMVSKATAKQINVSVKRLSACFPADWYGTDDTDKLTVTIPSIVLERGEINI